MNGEVLAYDKKPREELPRKGSSNPEGMISMLTSSHRISGRRAHRYLMAAWLLLVPLVGSGCDDAVDSDAVSADYSPDSAFILTHPSGAEIAIPAGARTTGLKIIVTVPPPSRRPGGAASVAITISPLDPGLTMPATVTLPITPSSIPSGGTVTIVQGTGGVFVPLPTRRTGLAVIAETFTFGDFFAVITLPADGGVPPGDLGVTDLGVADAAMDDAGGDDTGVADAGVDAGPFCGDGIWQMDTEQCDDGDQNRSQCLGLGTCLIGSCLFCLE
ncbi:MAG: DUF4215 domain-containing protein [Sandaracinaceae bacterium]|nr:DUF4215 domain-containing protein [Sandaracinaceae bacterium]